MTEKETLSDGKVVTRNESGQFTTVELTSEQARTMSKFRQPDKLQNTNAARLLQEAGYKPGTEPEHLRLLAKIASSGRSGSVAALRDFRKLTQPEHTKPIAQAKKTRVVEQVGGSDWLVKLDGKLYRKVGAEAAELARMIKDPDAVEPAKRRGGS